MIDLLSTSPGGGHFENLGIYELVRRRCQLVVACDVSQDPQYDGAELRERCGVDSLGEVTAIAGSRDIAAIVDDILR